MHLYLRCPDRLMGWLEDLRLSDGGQVELESVEVGVYRGEVCNWSIKKTSGRPILMVSFTWLCRQSLALDDNGVRYTRWQHVAKRPAPLSPVPTMEIGVRWYYHQTNKGNRVKIRTSLGESCRCHPRDHPTNLVLMEDGSITTVLAQCMKSK